MDKSTISIRPIEPKDNAAVEKVIRQVLTEYGANRPGFAWQDASLSALNKAYLKENEQYWVVLKDEEVVGGAGIAPLDPQLKGVCELQKMYLLPNARGLGAGRALIGQAITFASDYYQWCYLESLANMNHALSLYRKNGFIALPKPLIETDHSGCDQWFLKELR
jgi:putative acetyltransferase